jgi:hypothetical protein
VNNPTGKRPAAESRRVFSLPSNGPGGTVSLNRLVKDVARALQRRLPEPISLELQLAGGLPAIEADPRNTAELVVKLAEIVLSVCGDSGTLAISTSSIVRDGRGPKASPTTPKNAMVRLQICMVGGWGGRAAFRDVLARLDAAGVAAPAAGPMDGPKPPARKADVAVVVTVGDQPRGPTATILVPAAKRVKATPSSERTDQISA